MIYGAQNNDIIVGFWGSLANTQMAAVELEATVTSYLWLSSNSFTLLEPAGGQLWDNELQRLEDAIAQGQTWETGTTGLTGLTGLIGLNNSGKLKMGSLTHLLTGMNCWDASASKNKKELPIDYIYIYDKLDWSAILSEAFSLLENICIYSVFQYAYLRIEGLI